LHPIAVKDQRPASAGMADDPGTSQHGLHHEPPNNGACSIQVVDYKGLSVVETNVVHG
jgi:hypothetical protein